MGSHFAFQLHHEIHLVDVGPPKLVIRGSNYNPFVPTWSWTRQDSEGLGITEALDYALIPGFAICNTEKGDGGLTLEELHADICQDFIASVSDADAAEYNFEMFDSNADGVVTLKEFLDLADSLINM